MVTWCLSLQLARSESEEVLYEDVPKPRRRLGAKTDPNDC